MLVREEGVGVEMTEYLLAPGQVVGSVALAEARRCSKLRKPAAGRCGSAD